jgi:predicted exporter
LAAAVLVSAVAGWGLTRLDLSADLRSMRPADHPATAAENLLVATFGVGLDTLTVVAPGGSLGQALDHAAAARSLLAARLGPDAQISSPSDWLPGGERLHRRMDELKALPLRRAVDDLERELTLAGFRSEPFAPALAVLRVLGEGRDPGTPPLSTWPRFLRELVRIMPEGAAVAIHARLPLAADSAAASEQLAQELRRASPGLALASVPRMGASLRALALSDLARSSALAAGLVAAVVLVAVGWRLGDAVLSSVPLALGCLWTFGLWGALGGRVDLLAISALPVLFGTGIDLGVHAVHGGRLRPEEGIRGTLERSGLAMALVAATTGIGFGSLGSSRVPGIENAGLLVAVGVLACLLATWTVLPALAALLRRGGR